MLFCLQAEEDFFSTVVYTELAPLETAMIVSQVWKHNRAIWEKFNHLGSHGIIAAQQSYLRKVKVSLFTWNRCSTTWRQRAWVSGPPLGWPRSRNATPRNEQVLWMINCFYFFCRNFEKLSGKNISTLLIPSLQGQASRCRGSCGRPLFHFPKKLNLFPCRYVRNLCGLRFKFCFF